MDAPRIMIMGVGNVLLSDEGVGIHILKQFKEDEIPINVELIEAGTAGLELAHLIQDTDFLIVVDAVNAKSQPGALFRFKPDDITIIPEMFEVSFHQVGIMEVLSTVSIFGTPPKTIIYGVQPKSLDWGMELSQDVAAILPGLKEQILREISHINNTLEFLP